MAWVAVGTTAVGMISGAGGAFLGGRAGDIKRKRIEGVANTPGLDIGQITGESLNNQQRYLPQANQLVSDEAKARQATINQLLEQSMPGFTKQRDAALGTAGSYLKGEIPQDVQDLVQRKASARALGGGYGGAGMHGALTSRDLGRTSLDMQGQGLSWLTALRGMSPTATPQSAFNFTGPTANQLTDVRGQERTQKMGLMAQAAGVGGQTQAWANYLTQQGSMLEGAGLNMMGLGKKTPDTSGGGNDWGGGGFVDWSGTRGASPGGWAGTDAKGNATTRAPFMGPQFR